MMKLSIHKSNKKDSLKDKKLLLATWGCGDKDTYQCRDWIPLFEKMFGKLLVLPFRNYYYFHGKEALNKRFLDIIKEEKPDYLLFGQRYNEIAIETIKKIKEISPQTKTIIEHGDDDFKFDDWGRYYAIFFDYVITTKKDIGIYQRDNINSATFLHGINPDFFKPLNLERKYEVTFIGRPVADRYDYIRFLKEQGVNIRLFGGEWNKHPDLKDIYEGVLYDEDFPKLINQSKINLNFSKTLYEKGKSGQLKSRIFEVPACGAFLLNEYTDNNIEFINNKKEINFKNRKELLEKINYYLKHEKEREKLAKAVYRYIVQNYSWESLFSEFFKKINEDKHKTLNLPEINKKVIKISYNELIKSPEEIKRILGGVDYVSFSKANSDSLPYRDYLQAYSLSISKKKISCCDYYSHSRLLGDYLIFKSKNAFNTKTDEFYHFLDITQLTVTKEYFLKNLDFFKHLYAGKSDVSKQTIKNEDVVFISIPLIRIKNLPKAKYGQIKENFYTLFFDKLFSLIYQKKFFNPYIFKFFLFSLLGNFFIIKYLFYRLSFNFNKNILRSLGIVK